MSQCSVQRILHSVQRILHMDLKLFLHKIFLVHKLPGHRDKMNFFSTHVFWTRAIFIRMGLWINRICSFERRNLQRTFTTKAVTEQKPLFGLPCPTTAYSALSFYMKQYTLSNICICSKTTSCCNLWHKACIYWHCGLCKMVPGHIL
jgi:hypothetical protein